MAETTLKGAMATRNPAPAKPKAAPAKEAEPERAEELDDDEAARIALENRRAYLAAWPLEAPEQR